VNLNLIKNKASIPNNSLPVLVFIHGAWHGAWCWEENFMPFFTKNGFECYAFDLPNHGQSKHQKGINKHRISDYVNNLKSVLSEINKPYVLIGHSMGGYVVQQYLEENDCEAAILLASVPGKPIWRLLFKMTAAYPASMLQSFLGFNLIHLMNTPEKARKFLFSRSLSAEKVEAYTKLMSSESLSVILFDFLLSKLKRRKNLSYPLLVQCAEKDEMVTITENRGIAEMQKADFIEIKDIAHDVMLDPNWKLSAISILNWLRENLSIVPQEKLEINTNENNPKVNVEFPNAIPDLIINLGKKNSVDANKTKILGLGKSKRDN